MPMGKPTAWQLPRTEGSHLASNQNPLRTRRPAPVQDAMLVDRSVLRVVPDLPSRSLEDAKVF
jgi:hypothetical protein